MIDDGWPYTKRFHDNDEPKTLNGAWFLPRFNYWTVRCSTAYWVKGVKGRQWQHYKTYKFFYERGENPEEYVHNIFNRFNISLGNGEYVNDHTNQFYKLSDYSFVETKDDYDELECEELK
jgi:hypothetical protein